MPLEDCSSPLGAPPRLIASSRIPLEAKRNWRNACRNSRLSILSWTQNSLYIIIDHDRSLCIISLCHTKWPETKYHLNADLFGSVILRLRVLRRGCSPEEPVGPEFRLSCMIFESTPDAKMCRSSRLIARQSTSASCVTNDCSNVPPLPSQIWT